MPGEKKTNLKKQEIGRKVSVWSSNNKSLFYGNSVILDLMDFLCLQIRVYMRQLWVENCIHPVVDTCAVKTLPSKEGLSLYLWDKGVFLDTQTEGIGNWKLESGRKKWKLWKSPRVFWDLKSSWIFLMLKSNFLSSVCICVPSLYQMKTVMALKLNKPLFYC